MISLSKEARVSASYITKKSQVRATKKKGNAAHDSWIIRGISFEAKAGEAIRLIGKNESGRSTLVKIIAGLSSPTTGQLVRIGEVVFLSDENRLNPKLSGRDNIRLLCLSYGSTPKKAKSLAEDIIAFSGLSSHIDKPVGKYPKGLATKLKLSIIIHQAADIFIIDGNLFDTDKSFIKAYSQKITELKAKGKIIFISSSRLLPIKDPFDKAFWIENGVVKSAGLPQEVVAAYHQDSANYKNLSKQDKLILEKKQKKEREGFEINSYSEQISQDLSTSNSLEPDVKQFFELPPSSSNQMPLFYKLLIVSLILCFIFIILNYVPTRPITEIISEFLS